MKEYLKIHPADNVAVALIELKQGNNAEGILLGEDIPAGHKFALTNIAKGDDIVKYGYPIGHAIKNIIAGEWVNEKNIKTNLEGIQNYTFSPRHTVIPPVVPRTFMGYPRENGDVGIRNEIWIVPTVGCVNGTAQLLARKLQEETGGKGVDAIIAFPHNYGCSQLGDDHNNTRQILSDLVMHPNAGGVLVIGLGCENNQLSEFMKQIDGNLTHIRYMETQKIEGNEIEHGLALLRELYNNASQNQRTEQPLLKLRVGLKCGGSDGLSGITANPLLGAFSDYLTAQQGTTVLTEVPEMFGAETILMNRCQDKNTFDKTVSLINNFKNYFIKNEQPIYENPSPGNKAGGISTLEEKSLGCTQKSGLSVVRDVLSYGDRIHHSGLNLLSAPGNDLVAATALGAAGCHLILFTTGRGTPFGSFVPTMKISTNTPLYQNKPHWIDFDAGTIAQGETLEACCHRFVEYIIDVANGTEVNNEKNNFREIAIFKTGVTL